MHEGLDTYFTTSGEVILPGIEEKLVLPKKTWFRYDGEVKSLAANLAKTELILRGMLGLNRSWVERIMDWPMDVFQQEMAEEMVKSRVPYIDVTTAYCFPHVVKRENAQAYVIAKKRGLSVSRGLFADGHESGEFLQHLARQDLLQQYLEEEGVSLDVRKYEKEEFADIGGLLALRKAVKRGVQEVMVPTFSGRPAVLEEQRRGFDL